jgi:hypothetical protein
VYFQVLCDVSAHKPRSPQKEIIAIAIAIALACRRQAGRQAGLEVAGYFLSSDEVGYVPPASACLQ